MSLTILILVVVLALLLLGAPLFLVVGSLAALLFYFFTPDHKSFETFTIFAQRMFELTDKNVLLAIPFFVVSGAIMTEGKIAARIINFSKALVGSFPGGMAISTVAACMVFAAISGSSLVTVVAIGSMTFPAMVRDGYPEKFSLGLVTSAGSLGILIPPSIPMLIYAIAVTGAAAVDPSDLFLAGLLPGLVIGMTMMAYGVVLGWNKPWGRIPFSWANLRKSFREGFWSLLLPGIILGGIYSGLFTPTEAAAVAVVYAVVIEMFVHREFTLKKMAPVLIESAIMMGSLIVIMAMSFALNDYLVGEQIPDRAAQWVRDLDLSVYSFLVVLNLLLLAVGAVMDIISAILIVAPLMAPVAVALGIDAIHLGIIFIVNLEIGFLTPPIGLNLFVSSSVFRKPIGLVIQSVVPFIALMVAGLMVLTYIPSLSIGPVRVLEGGDFYQPLVHDKIDEAAPGGGAVGGDAGGVLTLEEMMKKTMRAADDDDDDDAGEQEPDRVLTLEEMMKKTMAAVEDDAAATATANAASATDQAATSTAGAATATGHATP